MKVYVKAYVGYTCQLDENQAKQVVEYMAENDCDAEYAVEMLYGQGGFDLYHHSVETDFSTEAVESVEFDEDDDELLAEYGLE